MKKSKIIVPALALLLLSTAATVSGSVAWFTANRTFSTNINDFEVVNTEGNLEVEMGSGLGTTAAGNKQSVSIDSGVKLGDASFDHDGGHLYTDTLVADTYKDLGAYDDAQITTKWLIAGTTYYAVTWTMDFKFTFAADLTQQNLYLNPTSTMTKATGDPDQAGTNNKEVALGFRIAFVGTTSSVTEKKVWSGLQTDAKLKQFNYVNGTTSTGTYSSDVISTAATGGTSSLVQPTAANGGTTAANYLGKFTSATQNNTVTISFTCVAWFEGSDENVVNASEFRKVSAGMKFFVLPNA